MKRCIYISVLLLLLIYACKRPFEPPVIKAVNQFLVVDGMLNNSLDSPTTIILSRTKNLGDTVVNAIETGAQVFVDGSNGSSVPLTETSPGRYTRANLSLNVGAQYRLFIKTTNGKEYVSEYVPVRTTQPIDSITWSQPDDLTIYVNSDDPTNSTRYYRWDFVETWQYNAQIFGDMDVKNGMIYYLDSTTQIYSCWKTRTSTDILIGNTVALYQDVVNHVPVLKIPKDDERVVERYSMLLKQYAITQEAHRYWQILKKNTENLGSLFDAQPAELVGNFRCVTDPTEPVVGFLSASNVQQKRLFIRNNELNGWANSSTSFTCDLIQTLINPVNYLIYDQPDLNYIPIYFTTSGYVVSTKRVCVDCRLKGGISKKPSFW